MIKIVSAFIGLVLATGLAGCGEGEKEVSFSAPETTDSEVTDSVVLSDAQFADFIRDNTDQFDGASDEQIVETGESVCGIFDAGGDFDNVVMAIIDSGVNAEDGGFLAGAGVVAYCPEYENEIPGG